MRKSFDGLQAVASLVAQEDVLSGSLYLFMQFRFWSCGLLSGLYLRDKLDYHEDIRV
jgi:hypothetical protein